MDQSKKVKVNPRIRSFGLRIIGDEHGICIRQRLTLRNKENWGVYFFLFGGLFFLFLPSIRPLEPTSLMIVYSLGGTFVTLSILTLIRQTLDFVAADGKSIRGRFNLRLFRIPVSEPLHFMTEFETLRISRVATVGSTFIIVTHFTVSKNRKVTILRYQANQSDEPELKVFANYVQGLLEHTTGVKTTQSLQIGPHRR